MVQAESNTATGLTVVPKVTVHQVIWALQRKLRHLQVPRSGYHGSSQEGGLNPSCGPPPGLDAWRLSQRGPQGWPNGGGPLVRVDDRVRLRWSERRGSVW
jgi:hypothetical protein